MLIEEHKRGGESKGGEGGEIQIITDIDNCEGKQLHKHDWDDVGVHQSGFQEGEHQGEAPQISHWEQ